MKYTLKLIFLKCIFEFLINTAQTASMVEKNCFDMTKLIFQTTRVIVMQWSRSCLNVQINGGRLPATLFSVSLYRVFFSVWSLFLTLFFLLAIFFFIITADHVHHALGSIYVLSLSPEFYFGKGVSKALDLHTGQAYYQKKKNTSFQDTFLL